MANQNLEKLVDLLHRVDEINGGNYGFHVEVAVSRIETATLLDDTVTRQAVCGIKASMQRLGSTPYWYLRYTDPRTHKQTRIATHCERLHEAWAFAYQHLATNGS